jgi:hypothetical protein
LPTAKPPAMQQASHAVMQLGMGEASVKVTLQAMSVDSEMATPLDSLAEMLLGTPVDTH